MGRLGLLVAAIVALMVLGYLVAYLAPNLSIAGQFRPQNPIIRPSIEKLTCKHRRIVFAHVRNHNLKLDKPVTLELSARVGNLTEGWSPYLEINGHLIEMKEANNTVLFASYTLRNLTRVPVWLSNETIAVPYKVCLVYNASPSESEILKKIKNYTGNGVICNASIIPLNISSVLIKDVPVRASYPGENTCWAYARELAIGYYTGIYDPEKLTQIGKLLAYYKNFNEMELTLIEKYHFYETRLNNYILFGCTPGDSYINKNGTFVWKIISYSFPIKTEGLIPDLIALGYPTEIPIPPNEIYYNGWTSGKDGHDVLGIGFERSPNGIVYRVINYYIVHPLSGKFVDKKFPVDIIINGTIPNWLADQANYDYNEPLSLSQWLRKYG